MLTPAQIRSHRFISAVRGSYKADEVDTYFEEIASSYEQAFRENAELIKKISVLAQKIEEYRAEEDNIKATLLTAQRVADELLVDAQEKSAQMLQSATDKLEYAESSSKVKAQIVMDEANKTARDKIYEAENTAKQSLAQAEKHAEELLTESKREAVEQLEITKLQLQKENICLEILKKESSSFKDELLEKYRQHIEFIAEIPAAVAKTIKPRVSVEDGNQASSESAPQAVTDCEGEGAEEDIYADENARVDRLEEDPAEDCGEFDADEKEKVCFEEQEEADSDAETIVDSIDKDTVDDNNEPGFEDGVHLPQEPQIKQKGIDEAIDEIEDFLFESEELAVNNLSDTQKDNISDEANEKADISKEPLYIDKSPEPEEDNEEEPML